jgi:hypothetical protein
MIAIGLVLLLLAVGGTVDLVVENSNRFDVSVVGQTVANTHQGWFFAVGVGVGVVGVLGLAMLFAGMRAGLARRRERRQLRRELAARDAMIPAPPAGTPGPMVATTQAAAAAPAAEPYPEGVDARPAFPGQPVHAGTTTAGAGGTTAGEARVGRLRTRHRRA